MDRNTILAIVLCTIVIIFSTTIQAVFFAPDPSAVVEDATVIDSNDSTIITHSASNAYGNDFKAIGDEPDSSTFVIENEVSEFTFDPVGATVSSIKLKEHHTDGEPSEFIFKDSDDVNPFMLYVGDDKTNPIDAVFDYKITNLSDRNITQVRFSRSFETSDGKEFTINKIYAVPMNDEYMVQLVVNISTADGSSIPLNYDGDSYTLGFGPQVGPYFESMSSSYDYRRINYLRDDRGGKSNVNYSNGVFTYNDFDADEYLDWMSLTGKYFVAIGIPETLDIINEYTATNMTYSSGVSQENYFYFTRKATTDSTITDVYSYYLGPQSASELDRYDRAEDNVFGLEEHRLREAMDSSWLWWLETILNWCLSMIYRVIPNYGVAIIILTIIIKLLLHPLSKKGTESTAKMSALTPKLNAIKEKYPDDPQAQNAAMAKLYKEEGINPMSSCWPMLIQFPILIAFYGLLNKNIDLRGAMFIPGWITDLSIPETIFTLPFRIPLIGNQIHLLPILYTFSMIFSMKITQNSSSAAAGQAGMMKFMTYGMPIIFFFILYNAPSGLLVYWSATNLISIGTQIYVNKKKGTQFKLEIQKEDEEKALAKKKKRRK